MDKSRELYSKEGENSSQFEGKTVPWEHTIVILILGHVGRDVNFSSSARSIDSVTMFLSHDEIHIIHTGVRYSEKCFLHDE